MSKINAMEEESNPNYEEDQEAQLKLQEQFDAQNKSKKIQEAIELLQDNGFLVTIR